MTFRSPLERRHLICWEPIRPKATLMPIHPTAVIDPAATIDPTVEIGPYVVIDAGVRIGARCRLAPFVHILAGTDIAEDCRIHTGAILGDVPQSISYQECESFCRIGARTTIREMVTVHRGSLPGSATTIGDGCFIMSNAHVGHDCRIGDSVTLVNGSLLAGHVQIGDFVIVSGNAGVHQHVRIGDLSIIGGLAKVTQDVPPFMTITHDRGCAGINLIGLRRNGMSSEERADARRAYKTVYRSGLGLKDAIANLEQTAETRTGRGILEFIRVPSSRGLMGARGHHVETRE